MGGQAKFQPEDFFEIKGKGPVVTGQLLAGTIKVGMKTQIMGAEAKVLGIESFRKSWNMVDAASNAPKNLGLLLSSADKEAIKNLAVNKIPLIFEETVGV